MLCESPLGLRDIREIHRILVEQITRNDGPIHWHGGSSSCAKVLQAILGNEGMDVQSIIMNNIKK